MWIPFEHETITSCCGWRQHCDGLLTGRCAGGEEDFRVLLLPPLGLSEHPHYRYARQIKCTCQVMVYARVW